MAVARLGEILVEAGVIDASQLTAALAEQKDLERPLGMTLVRMGYLDEPTLIKTLSRQLQLPMARLSGKRIPHEVLELVPLDVADKHRCFPLFLKGEGAEKRLFLGMEDPSNQNVIDELSQLAGVPIQPVLVAPSEIEEALHRHHDLVTSGGSSLPFELLSAPGVAPAEERRLDPSPFASSLLDGPADGPDLEAALDPDDDSLGEASSELLSFSEEGTSERPTAVESVPQVEILRALTQLLIQKGVFTRDELIERVHAFASSADSDPER